MKPLPKTKLRLPLLLVIAGCNQAMIEAGVRFNSSLIAASGQLASAHDMATALGFGASALAPFSVHNRIISLFGATMSNSTLPFSARPCIKAC